MEEIFSGITNLVVTFFLVVIPSVYIVNYLERKIVADVQARVGPNRTGHLGILQPVADVLKLLTKKSRWSLRTVGWNFLIIVIFLSTLSLLPLAPTVLVVESELNVFFSFWLVALLPLVLMFQGMSTNIKNEFGGFRVGIQGMIACIPAFIALLGTGIVSGGFSWLKLESSQTFSPMGWLMFETFPFQFLSFVVFFISGLVLLNIRPFDAGRSDTEIRSGIMSSRSGYEVAWMNWIRSYSLFYWSVITVCLFAGGWILPEFVRAFAENNGLFEWLWLLRTFLVLFKALILVLLVGVLSRIVPRYRIDQATELSWTVLAPIALLCLTGTAIVHSLGGLQ